MKDITAEISKKTLVEINNYIKDLSYWLKYAPRQNRAEIYKKIKNAKEHRKRCLTVLVDRES